MEFREGSRFWEVIIYHIGGFNTRAELQERKQVARASLMLLFFLFLTLIPMCSFRLVFFL